MFKPKYVECEYCRETSFTDSKFEVKTQRGQIVGVIFNYCPVCGRDLRKPLNKSEYEKIARQLRMQMYWEKNLGKKNQ